MRMIKHWMKNHKRKLSCSCLHYWRCQRSSCSCSPEENIFIYGIAQTFEVDGEQWRIFANGTYITVTNDNGTEVYFTSRVGYSELPEDSLYTLTIIDDDNYNVLKALTDKLHNASDKDGVDAKTEITDEEQALIINNINRVKSTIVNFKKDGENIVGVYDYKGENKLGEFKVEGGKYYLDNKEIAIQDSEDGDAIKDYFTKTFVEGAGNIVVDYVLSYNIRDLLKTNIVNSIEEVDSTLRVTNSEGTWLYDIQIESDGVTIQVVENDEEVIGSFSLAFEDSEDLLDYLPFVAISKRFNDIVTERIENDDFIHNV